MTHDVDKGRIANATTTPDEHEEIEITPEMIDVGMREYAGRWCGLRDAEDDVAREMLAAAYAAMYRLRPRSSGVARGISSNERRSRRKLKQFFLASLDVLLSQLTSSGYLKSHHAPRRRVFPPRIMHDSISSF